PEPSGTAQAPSAAAATRIVIVRKRVLRMAERGMGSLLDRRRARPQSCGARVTGREASTIRHSPRVGDEVNVAGRPDFGRRAWVGQLLRSVNSAAFALI